MLSGCIQLSVCLMVMPWPLNGRPFTDDYDDNHDLVSDTEARMYGGNITSYKDHPYFVTLMRKVRATKELKHSCGGAFVARDMILTAAHCLFDLTTLRPIKMRDLRAKYGSNEASNPPGPVNASKMDFGYGFFLKITGKYPHPDFVPIPNRVELSKRDHERNRMDYALIRFKPPADRNYRYLLLPEPQEADLYLTRGLTLVSAGKTIDNAQALGWPNKTGLIMRQSKMYPHNKGCMIYHLDRHPSSLCSTGGQQRLCAGDSGSPLYTETARGKVIIAMVKAGFYGCSTGTRLDQMALSRGEDIFKAVGDTQIMRWITYTLAIHSRCFCSEKLMKMWHFYKSNIHF